MGELLRRRLGQSAVTIGLETVITHPMNRKGKAMSRRMRHLLGALAVSAALLHGSSAQAMTFNGYVGVVSLTPAKGNLGSGGYLHLEVYSQPAAGGFQVTHAYICSTGATYTGCDLSTTAYGPKYLYSEAQLLALYKSLVEAAANNLKVSVTQPSAGSLFQGIAILPAD
jgi:hypothetical protein